MSAPSNDWLGLIPLAVVGASLLGSSHCLAMCGGLAISVGRTRAAIAQYHLGRLAGYLALGALAGKLGQAVLSGGAMSVVSWVSTALLALGFIALGVNVWRGKGMHLFALPQSLTTALFRRAGGQPLAVGLLSALLPCGWLHGFVLGAVGTGSALAGAAFLFCFWLGTVPALSFAPWLVDRVLKPLAARVPRLSAMLLIAAGVTTVGLRASMLLSRDTAGDHCHPSATQQVGPPADHSHHGHHAH